MSAFRFLFSLLIVAAFTSAAQNTDISGGLVFEGEPYMAINPANPKHIVVAWMGYVPLSRVCIKVKTSFNGGTTWSSAAMMPHRSPSYTSADVSLAFDHTGSVHVCYIDSRQSPDSGGVYVSRSTDGGLTWGTAHKVIDAHADGSKTPLDRPWLVIGKGSGSAPDTMYVTTKPAPWIAVPNRPYFMKSGDYGVTWTSWKYIDSTGFRVGSLIQAPMASPAVDSEGRFHCVYPSYYPAESVYPRYIYATAAAGAFTYNTVIAAASTGISDTLPKLGGHLVCDPANNRHAAFFSVNNSGTDLDISCMETANGGTSWASPFRVNDDAVGNGKMQDLVWAGLDEHGNLVAAWRDRRNAVGTGYAQASEIWAAIKWKDSAAFSANFRLSDTIVAYDSTYLAGNGNDFMNVGMANDTVKAVWGDVRTGVLRIWFTMKKVNTPGPGITRQLVAEALPVVNIFPNPTPNILNITGERLVAIELNGVNGGRLIHRQVKGDKDVIDLSHLPSGTYILSVKTQQGIVSSQVVKQ